MHQLQWQKLPFKIQILALSSTMKKTTSALQTWQEANYKSILSSVGLALKALSNILVNGKCCTIPILIVPNSVQLKMRQEVTILCFQ